MIRTARLFGAAALLSLICSSTADAAARRVQFSGCVSRGVEHGCLMVRSGGQTYNISSANPRPPVNWGISGYGTRSGGVSFCQQGVILTNVHWQRNRLLCPLGHPGRRR